MGERESIEDHAVTEVLLPFREEIAGRRERQTWVKAKYGLRSPGYLIQESNQKILDYQARQAAGEQVELPLLNEQRNLKELRQRRQELEREIRLGRNLTVGGGAAGGRRGTYSVGMRRDEEVEAAGMRVAMEYERGRDWHPHGETWWERTRSD